MLLLTKDLTPNQTLVLLGTGGQRWDVENGESRRKHGPSALVLERWVVDCESPISDEIPELPVTYKKSVVVFRALYTLMRLLPTWKLRKKLSKLKLTGNALKVVCEIDGRAQTLNDNSKVALAQSLVTGHRNELGRYSFHKVETPAGRLSISVEYRIDCDFRVDDSEALLSSQFITSDRRSTVRISSSTSRELPNRRDSQIDATAYAPTSVGGRSPALLANVTDVRGLALARPDRRPSAALIQPFKTPSLSASPSLDQLSSSPRSLSHQHSPVSVDRQGYRSSSYTQSQRIPSSLGEVSHHGLHVSPRPQPAPQLIKRYSSSFGQRSTSFLSRRRPSQASDGTPALEASGIRGSSRSPVAPIRSSQEDDLGDFLQMFDNRPALRGVQFSSDNMRTSRMLAESAVDRTQAGLRKFQHLKESHARLGESLLQNQQVPSDTRLDASSRVQPSQPILHPNTSGTSLSGKSMSPHTPAIPSRLSESSVMPRPQFAPGTIEQSSGAGTGAASHARTQGFASVSKTDTAVTALQLHPVQRSASFSGRARLEPQHTTASESRSLASKDVSNLALDSWPSVYPRELRTGQSQDDVRVRNMKAISMDHSSQEPSAPSSGTLHHLLEGSERATRDPCHLKGTSSLGPGQTACVSPGAEDDELFFAMSDLHLVRDVNPRS